MFIRYDRAQRERRLKMMREDLEEWLRTRLKRRTVGTPIQHPYATHTAIQLPYTTHTAIRQCTNTSTLYFSTHHHLSLDAMFDIGYKVISKRITKLRRLKEVAQDRRVVICAYALMRRDDHVMMVDCWRRWKLYFASVARWKAVSWNYQLMWHEGVTRSLFNAWRMYTHTRIDHRQKGDHCPLSTTNYVTPTYPSLSSTNPSPLPPLVYYLPIATCPHYYPCYYPSIPAPYYPPLTTRPQYVRSRQRFSPRQRGGGAISPCRHSAATIVAFHLHQNPTKPQSPASTQSPGSGSGTAQGSGPRPA